MVRRIISNYLGEMTLALAGAMVLAVMVVCPVRPALALEIVTSSGEDIEVEVSKGRLIRLNRAAATVFVADPEIADIQVKSPRLVYVFGKKPGDTTLFAVDQKERVLANVDITVIHDLSRLRDAIKQLEPNADVTVSSINGNLILDGQVKSARVAENIRRISLRFAGTKESTDSEGTVSEETDEDAVINRIGIDAPNQVHLRVRVAEVSREVDKQWGFNWNIIGDIGGIAIGMTTTNPFRSEITALANNANSVALGADRGKWDFSALIDALEEEGLLKIMAEPNLTALSGETAYFLAGGEFPIIVPQTDDRVTIEFKTFGVALAFTPTLIGETRINLHVAPEVSRLSTENAVILANFVVPSLITRRAETTIELGSGQSFVIGGLLQNNIDHDIAKFPGLGDVPVLGSLFRSDRFQRNESELVIIVTPYIVRPTARRQQMATPVDGMIQPHDLQRFVDGSTHRQQPKRGTPVTVDRNGKKLIGPVGFQLD
jgi:pilus assembly protein CpaC